MELRQHFLLGLACVALAACSSAVKLDTVPVEDKVGTTVQAPPTPPDKAPAAEATAREVKVVTPDANLQALAGPNGPRTVYFDYESFVIKPEFQPLLQAHANYLLAKKDRKLVIEGHTDERGGREYNLALGQKRADAVRRALQVLQVADGQMESVSYGKEKPAVVGGDEAAFAKNRRAELVYR